ncbi:hypothetical protein chiPu_0026588, partial [Chiloscyllium punctatum]|nr:hypothetical protein [Chiloscyllium punctatum]
MAAAGPTLPEAPLPASNMAASKMAGRMLPPTPTTNDRRKGRQDPKCQPGRLSTAPRTLSRSLASSGGLPPCRTRPRHPQRWTPPGPDAGAALPRTMMAAAVPIPGWTTSQPTPRRKDGRRPNVCGAGGRRKGRAPNKHGGGSLPARSAEIEGRGGKVTVSGVRGDGVDWLPVGGERQRTPGSER